MNASLRPALASLAFGAFLLVACGDTKSPTEPVVVPAALSPTPTVVPGQPAVMSGTVHGYGCLSCAVADVVVSCQGRDTVSGRDGSYSLTGLVSGTWTATARRSAPEEETFEVTVTLTPGSNTVNFGVY